MNGEQHPTGFPFGGAGAPFFVESQLKKQELLRRGELCYPTAIIRAKKNDHVVAIPPSK